MRNAAVRSCVFLALFASAAAASDWAHWRGPNSNGTSDEKGLLDRWPESGPQKVWEATIGPGIRPGNYRAVGSSPSIADGRVFVVGRDEREEKSPTDGLFCFSARDGKPLWKHGWRGDGQRMCHSTPTVADGRVFFLQSTSGFLCLDAATGNVLWQKDPKEVNGNFKGNNPSFGASSSPVVDGNVVYSGLAAFRVSDGKPVYPAKEWNLYNALTPGKIAGKKVLCLGGCGYDATTGEMLWEIKNCAGISTPIFLGENLLIYAQEPEADPAAPKHPRLYRIKVEGGKYVPQKIWTQPGVTGFLFHLTNFQNSSLAVSGDYAYAWFGSGAQRYGAACIELKTGKVTWVADGKPLGMAGECFSSPLVADHKIYTMDGTGQLYMFREDPTRFSLLGKAKVCERNYSSPVLANGLLYVRDDKKLVCLKVK